MKSRQSSHSVHSLQVHIVWIMKYRYNVLQGEVQLRCRDILLQVCNSLDIQILNKGVVSKDHILSDGFPKSTLVHDCWKPYFKTVCGSHQICTAHLLRELKYLSQLYEIEWTKAFSCLLTDALLLKRELLPVDYLQPVEKRKQLEQRLDELLQERINPKYEKLITFQNRLTAYRQHLFRFLYSYGVPADNNASERAVRTFKVKQKVSGFFRSTNGAEDFSIIRSVIDAAIKNSQNVWGALNCVTVIP